MTKRFVFLVCLGLPFLVISLPFGLYGPVFLIHNAVCLGLLTLDFCLTPAAGCLEIERDPEDKLVFKAENTLTLYVRTQRHLFVTLKDEIPDWHFTLLDDSHMTRAAEPGEPAAFSYTLLPSKRGAFVFPHVYGYITGSLGLCRKYFQRPLPMEYKVYPDLRDLRRYRLLTQKKMMEQGARAVRARLGATEFESLREYAPGDDYRKINWPVTARENKLILNQYEAEKNQPVFILIDAGLPMTYSLKGMKKLDYAVNAALILADIVNQRGDNSGLMVFDTDVRSLIAPGKGEAHRHHLMEALYHIQGVKNASDYEGAFYALLNRQKRRGLIFLFTDFETLEEARELAAAVQMLKRRHTPILTLMKNESLHKILDNPRESLETVFQKAMAMNFGEERRDMIRSFNALGIACVESEAEQFTLTAVNRYLAARNNQ
ncbi:MAG: DUF58 domain-containing protein [Clostridiales bacterium]|nr:DUF58 domain-containing protein [Clostridiales bacterium]